MSRSNNSEFAQRLFFTLVPLPPAHCTSCGRDPQHVYDANNQFVIAHDENARIDQHGRLCKECSIGAALFIAPYIGSSWGRK